MSNLDEPLPLSLFDFELPQEQVAQVPIEPRHHSRLLVLPRAEGDIGHRRFDDLPKLLQPHDLLVVNRSQVIPARLRLQKASGGKAEVLLCRPMEGSIASSRQWEGLGRPGKAFVLGSTLVAADGTAFEVCRREGRNVTLRSAEPILNALQRLGEVPLPPYIKRPAGPSAADRQHYQTVFAKEPGAVAAPTASLHFTPTLVNALGKAGVAFAEVVLHVGIGTFLPIDEAHAEDVRQHRMHAEMYEIPLETQRAVQATKNAGGRVIAVGTTSVRALETWGATGQPQGSSELYISPGFTFRVVDGMVTNFHLPRSTLLVMVSAFAGRQRLLGAYEEAVQKGYRFFSYGDAMVLM